MLYRLIIITGPRKGERVTIHPEPLRIGRDPGCELCLDDAELARSHAEVRQTGDGLFIRDLGTMNRILVNRHEVMESRLKHGDLVELGHTRFLVQAVVQAEVGGATGEDGESRRSVRRRLPLVLLFLLLLGGGVWWGTRDTAPATADLPPATPPAAPDPGSPPEPPPPPPLVQEPLLEPPAPWREDTLPRVNPNPRAAEELTRLRSEMQVLRQTLAVITQAPPAEAVAPDSPPPPLPDGTARIIDLQITRFPATDDHDDLRVLTVTLARTPKTLDPARLALRATFFVRDRATGALLPNPFAGDATATPEPGRDREILTARLTYLDPVGDTPPHDVRFAGYRLVLLRDGEELEQRVHPPALAGQIDTP